jgi:uncharacterized membrane protein YkvA (DUF1232 family)
MKLAAVRNFLKDSSVKRWRKALLLGAIAYVLVPFDAIPDTIPLLGWLDDVGFLSLAVGAVWRDVKRHSEQIAAREDPRRRGADVFEPVA